MRLDLVLIRHGEAVDAGALGNKDHARILTPRGQRQSLGLGAQLVQAKSLPSLALVSDAARTKETWAGATAGAGVALRDTVVAHHRLIYTGAVSDLQSLIEPVDAARYAVVAMVGHNPGISELACDLTSQDLRFSPADCMVLSIQAESWAEAIGSEGAWELVASLSPE